MNSFVARQIFPREIKLWKCARQRHQSHRTDQGLRRRRMGRRDEKEGLEKILGLYPERVAFSSCYIIFIMYSTIDQIPSRPACVRILEVSHFHSPLAPLRVRHASINVTVLEKLNQNPAHIPNSARRSLAVTSIPPASKSSLPKARNSVSSMNPWSFWP